MSKYAIFAVYLILVILRGFHSNDFRSGEHHRVNKTFAEVLDKLCKRAVHTMQVIYIRDENSAKEDNRNSSYQKP